MRARTRPRQHPAEWRAPHGCAQKFNDLSLIIPCTGRISRPDPDHPSLRYPSVVGRSVNVVILFVAALLVSPASAWAQTAAAPPDQFIDSIGIRLRYVEQGQGP